MYFNKKSLKKLSLKKLSECIVCGRLPVLELLKAGKRTVNKLIVSKTATGSTISEIICLAKQKGITIYRVPLKKIKKISDFSQGIAADVSPIEYIGLFDLIKKSKKSINPFIVLLDSVKDPHNLGAIIRNCVFFGVDGIIIPKRRAVNVNMTVSKVSAGAVDHISISRVSNINLSIDLLIENGFLIVGTTEKGELLLEKTNLTFPLAIIMGNEGFGLHNLTKKKCDFLISIPQYTNNTINQVSSLNVSSASAIIVYEVTKKRKI
ncbi:MAG: 23S rRNA (guanosine(2251)-2'-O)-methyltransferase RlmB [Endomicrobium sp.]|jgi:23S rRNA (guanosine2251-2'-O)-methyltransferase|nr:23S rRNA (guanosine(2251)-2'-O)-methyltransferase RlmB [Endomicrobium sp.]